MHFTVTVHTIAVPSIPGQLLTLSDKELLREATQSLQVGSIHKTQQQLLHTRLFIGRQQLPNRLRTANQGGHHTLSKPGFEFSRKLRQSLLIAASHKAER